MIELQVESAPVAKHEDVVALANDLAKQLATGPGAKTPEELWKQPAPSRKGMTLQQWKDEIEGKMREVLRLARIHRIDAPAGGYVHHDAKSGVLLEVEGGNDELAKSIAMHVAAMKPKATTTAELDRRWSTKEREILTEQARKEGKPDNIIEKMIEGRMRNFYAEHVLAEQPFVKDDKQIGRQSRRRRRDEAREIHPLAAGRNGRRETGRSKPNFDSPGEMPGLFL